MANIKDIQINLKINSDRFTGALKSAADAIKRLADVGKSASSNLNTAGQAATNAGTKINGMGRNAQQASSAISNLGTVMKTAFGTAIGVGIYKIVEALGALSTSVFTLSADYEKSTIAFEVMLGSLQNAQGLMAELQSLAAKTPLETSTLTSTTKLLIAYGIEQDKLIETTRRLGDVSQGQADILQRVAMQYGQVKAVGKASLQDLKAIAEAGIPIFDELAKNMGKSKSQIMGMVSEGEIGFSDLEKALWSLTDTGGQFNGMMDKMSKTVPGMWSTMMDNVNISITRFGTALEPLTKEILGYFVDMTNKISDYMQQITPVIQQVAEEMAENFEASVNAIADYFSEIWPAWKGVVDQLMALISDLGNWIIKVFSDNRAEITSIVKDIGTILQAIVTVARAVWAVAAPILSWIIARIAEALAWVAKFVAGVASAINWVGKLTGMTANATVKVDTSAPKVSTPKFTPMASRYPSSGVGGGDDGKAAKKARDSAAKAAKDALRDYQQHLQDKFKLEDQQLKLSLELLRDNEEKKLQLEKSYSNNRMAFIKSEMVKAGVSRKTLENKNADEIYNVDLSKFKGTQREKIKDLQDSLNEELIEHKNTINDIDNAREEAAKKESDRRKKSLDELKKQNQEAIALFNNRLSNETSYEEQVHSLTLSRTTMTEKAKLALESSYSNKRLSTVKQELRKLGVAEQEIATENIINMNNLDLTKFDEVNQAKIEKYVEMYNELTIEAAQADSAIARNTAETYNNVLQTIGTTAKSIFDTLTNRSLSFAEKMKAVLSQVLNTLAKIAMQSMASMPGKLGIIGKIGSLFFADGGIVPGNYSQEQIATVHGSEMVLNPSQQARLFAAANGSASAISSATGSGGGGSNGEQGVTVINQFNIQSLEPQTAASLVREQLPYIEGKIQEAILYKTSFKSAVRKATAG
jgi:tape measure domain-containing protein